MLKFTPEDVNDHRLVLHAPKSGNEAEIAFIPRRIADRLQTYIRDKEIKAGDKIFPIAYAAARLVVKKAGKLMFTSTKPAITASDIYYAQKPILS